MDVRIRKKAVKTPEKIWKDLWLKIFLISSTTLSNHSSFSYYIYLLLFLQVKFIYFVVILPRDYYIIKKGLYILWRLSFWSHRAERGAGREVYNSWKQARSQFVYYPTENRLIIIILRHQRMIFSAQVKTSCTIRGVKSADSVAIWSNRRHMIWQ